MDSLTFSCVIRTEEISLLRCVVTWIKFRNFVVAGTGGAAPPERLPTSMFSPSRLKPTDQDILNNGMREYRFLLKEPSTDEEFIPVCQVTMIVLLTKLAETSLREKFIFPDNQACYNIVEGFNEREKRLWIDGTRKALQDQDWSGLAMHPRLKRQEVVSPAVSAEQKNAVVRAWNGEYRGNSHKVLLQAIDELHSLPVNHNYAKIIPIVQSSGTGKSRIMDKISEERIVFSMCLRENLPDDVFAYPPSDFSVRHHLMCAPSTARKEDCKQYLRNFLSALFDVANGYLCEHLNVAGETSYKEMARIFRMEATIRSEFYDHVLQKARATPDIQDTTTIWTNFRKMEEIMKRHCSKWPKFCTVLLSIDEIHVLHTPRLNDLSDCTLYSWLKSVLNEGVKYSFGFVCMSTASHIAMLAPSKGTAPSMRERAKDRILPAPFTELPFDVFLIADPLLPDRNDLSSVGQLEFTVKFGRPHLYASYLAGKEGGDVDIDHYLDIFQEKLSGCPLPDASQHASVGLNVTSIAILSVRLLLDLSPFTVQARRYEEALVHNHLRLIYSANQDRHTIVTGSSPEPVIAEASAQLMNLRLQNGKPYMKLWELLDTFIDHGLASQGAIGELIGRALSISAMDLTINKLPQEDVRELRYQTPVRVTDYYRTLLTEEAWKTLSRSVPANRAELTVASASKTFLEAFQNSYFHFSHYGRANDESPIRDNSAWAYWLRGTAIACQLNQELTDRMIPIYFPDCGNVSPMSISANLDQDKTGESVNPANVATQSAEQLSIFSYGNKLPYIAAVHCYALQDQESIKVKTPSSCKLPSKKDSDSEAPRYQIDFLGLQAYGNITLEDKIIIQRMINRSKDSVFKNHSREYGVDAVRQMLPVLTEHPSATAWFGGLNAADQWHKAQTSRMET